MENGEPTYLLTRLGYKPEEESDSNVETVVSSVRVTVRLLHAVKVPGHHDRLVKVQVYNINNWELKPMLFSLQQHKEEWAGIVAASCVTGKAHCGESQSVSNYPASRRSDGGDGSRGYVIW